jgi:hypothetical protein
MIIHKPQITTEKDEICVSARIDMETPGLDVPDTLWYKFPKHYADFVTDRADAFIVGLLPTAMLLRESILVKGTISPRLAWGIREYQHAQSIWWPGNLFSVVDTRYEDLTEAPPATGGVGCSISGGVDSFYTLRSHMPVNETIPEYQLTHCLIINGYDYDTDLEETGRFRRTMETFEPVAERAGVKLLTSRTNLRYFRHGHHGYLNISFEAPITAPVLVLGNLFSRFYIPGSGSYSYENLIPVGPFPITWPLLGTEGLQVIADGHDATRAEKTEVVAQWPETYPTLRVCWRIVVFDETTGLIENCCRCQKCVRTMLALDLVGALHKYKTFPLPLRRRDIWRIDCVKDHQKVFFFDNLNLARRVSRRDRVADLHVARLRARLRRIVAWLFLKPLRRRRG